MSSVPPRPRLTTPTDVLRSVRRSVRTAIPLSLRERLYDWNPERRRSWRRTPGLERLRGAPGAALTFDDGPDPIWTPATLEALAEAGATATFFLVGARVAAAPEVVREIVAGGHEVAIHGMEHRRHDQLSAAAARAELSECGARIEGACGVAPTRYRPPYGASGPTLAAACEELGLELTYWSSWGQDWDPIGAARIARLVGRDLDPGAIVLLHDSALFAARVDPAATVGAIPLIAADAAARGLRLSSIAAAAG
ncbi:MAG: polysaccharide deacetylase family protein [Actinobacteria bacterium]|nr:polysaccharide deacetylase family protein [Actinomycetota bacterium]